MAEDVNVLQLTELLNPATPGVWFYCGVEGDPIPDRKLSYEKLVQFLALKDNQRANGNVTVASGTNIIQFKTAGVNTPFPNADYSLNIYDSSGLGIGVISQDKNGFTIEVINSGAFNYIATLNT